jgi:hypothetical protein
MKHIASILVCLAALAFTAPLHAQKTDSTAKSHASASTGMSGKTHHPKDATAKCTDGTYSMSASTSGSCSGHGGVAKWYAKARCTDGTLWMNSSKQGACSGHQGVAEWLNTKKSTK